MLAMQLKWQQKALPCALKSVVNNGCIAYGAVSILLD